MADPATTQAASTASMFSSLLPFVAIIGIFYFLVIRPQMRRQREHGDMLSNLQRGDQVLTSGGVYGKITKVMDDRFEVEIADGMKIQVNRSAIAELVARDTSTKDVTAKSKAKKAPAKKAPAKKSAAKKK